MPWCWWNDVAAFTSWHDGITASKGIPYPGRNLMTAAPAITQQWTDAYTDARTFIDGNRTRVVALVLAPDAAGLNVLDEYTPNPDGTITVRIGTQTRTVDPNTPNLQVRKSKPPTYTMDGVTYNTTTGQPV